MGDIADEYMDEELNGWIHWAEQHEKHDIPDPACWVCQREKDKSFAPEIDISE